MVLLHKLELVHKFKLEHSTHLCMLMGMHYMWTGMHYMWMGMHYMWIGIHYMWMDMSYYRNMGLHCYSRCYSHSLMDNCTGHL